MWVPCHVSAITLGTQQGLPSQQVSIPGPGDLPQIHFVTWDIHFPLSELQFPHI